MKLLICENLNYNIGYKRIFQNLSFEINLSELWILTGENGVGKSTLLKILFSGSFKEINWKINSKFPVSYLGHELGLYTSLSLKENLDYFYEISNKIISKNEIESLLELFNLKKRYNDPVHTFSEGMKKKSGILRALIFSSELLLLDEPFNGLDESSSKILYSILKNYKSTRSIIIATHNPDYLKDISNGEWKISNYKLEKISA